MYAHRGATADPAIPAKARIEFDAEAKRTASRKVDLRLPGKGNGARPIHLIITVIQWIRTSRLSIKNSLYAQGRDG